MMRRLDDASLSLATKRSHRRVGKTGVITAYLGGALSIAGTLFAAPVLASPDNPDATDRSYLAMLRNANSMTINDEAYAIKLGQWVCETRRSGVYIASIVSQLRSQYHLDEHNAPILAYAAEKSYCPEFL